MWERGGCCWERRGALGALRLPLRGEERGEALGRCHTALGAARALLDRANLVGALVDTGGHWLDGAL